MDPMRFLTTTDQIEVLTMQAISRAVLDLREEASKANK